MDAYEATQVVFARVQAMDPENVSKIIGFLLLQDRSEQEMGRLALASDALVQAAIARARRELGLHHQHHHQYHHHHHRPPLFVNTTDDFVVGGSGGGGAARFMRTQQQPPPPPATAALQHQEHHQLAWKPCLYYSRGYCKHGASCRFLHGNCSPLGDSSSSASPTSPSPTSPSSTTPPHHHFLVDEDEAGSLERLELELQELLRGRRGVPISIASLPQLYYERFGKALQAQGYRTESQRHGKTPATAAVAGPSTNQSNLTKLLARLKGTVALIDRPHGQHAVVLAEEAHRFVGYRADRDDLKDASPSSRQIYLTFPAESTFSEEDVSNHFRAYGPVQDVRIPYQQKRMFGFVTFLYPETVKTILSEGNPHYICGSRVLVKPYREKAKLHERKLDPLRAAAAAAAPQIRDTSFYDAFTRRLEEERMLDMERRRLMAAEKLVQAKLLLSSNEHQQESLLNGMPVTNTSTATLTTSTSSMASTDVHGPLEPAMTSEDIRSNTPFGYVLDVLDNGDDERDPVPAAAAAAAASSTTTASPDSSSSCEPFKSTTAAHFLPECPFAASADEDGQEEQQQLKDKLMGMDLSDIFSPRRVSSPRLLSSPREQSVICCICYKHCIEPSKLNCSHTFCVQCILKVIRGSKDECPICRQHIGSQVYKILQNRDLQSWLSSPNTTQLIQQQIW